MKRNNNKVHPIPDGLDLFNDQNPQKHVSDDPSDLVLVLMAKSSNARDAQKKSKK